MSYPENVQRIINELNSGILTANTEEAIKRILMSTMEIYDTHYSNEHCIMEKALDNKDYHYDPRTSHPDKTWTSPLKKVEKPKKAVVLFQDAENQVIFSEMVDMVDVKDDVTIRYIQGVSVSWVNDNVGIKLHPFERYMRVNGDLLKDAEFQMVSTIDNYDFSLDHPKKIIRATQRLADEISYILIKPVD